MLLSNIAYMCVDVVTYLLDVGVSSAIIFFPSFHIVPASSEVPPRADTYWYTARPLELSKADAYSLVEVFMIVLD